MKLSDIQGKYTVVSNPTKLSELQGNYTSVNQPPSTPNDSSAALSNSTALVDQKSAFDKFSEGVQNFFPGKQVGDAIGTLAGYFATPKDQRDQYDLSHPSVTQVIGDVGKGATALVGLEAKLPASILGKAGQFAAYSAAGSGFDAISQGKSAKDIGKEAATGAAIGAATGGAFGALGKGLNKILAPFKGAFNKGAATAFESEGIKAPVSAITKSPALQAMEATAGKNVFGQDIIDMSTKATQDLDTKVNDIVSKLKPEKSMSDQNIGKMLQDGLKEYEDKFKVTEGKLYDSFSKTYGKSNVYGMATKDALNTLIKEQGNDYFSGVDSRLSKMFNRITGSNNPELKALNDTIEEAKAKGAKQTDIDSLEKQFSDKQAQLNKSLTFDELKSTRSSVGEQLQKEPQNTALKRLYGALSKDMQSAVSKAAETPFGEDAKAASEALDKLNKGYASGKNKIESNIAASIGQSNPEQIAQNLIKRNSADMLSQVKEMVGEDRFKEVSKSFLRQKLENSVTRGAFDVEKLKKNLGEYDKETLDQIMDPSQQKDLKDAIQHLEKYKSMGDLLKAGSKIGSGSQTAFLQNVKGLGSRTTGFIAALSTGHPLIAAGLLAETGGEYAFSKLFTSDLGRKILTEGINSNNLGLLSQAGYSAAQITKIKDALDNKPDEQSSEETQ